MANMSYCRFQNTMTDFSDCCNAIEDLVAGESEPLSRDEHAAAVRLLEAAIDLVSVIGDRLGLEAEDLLDGNSHQAAVDFMARTLEDSESR